MQCWTSLRNLLDQNEAARVQDLCRTAWSQMVFFELCPNDDWARDAFNEDISTLCENLVCAFTKLTQQQDELKSKQTDLSNRMNKLTLTQNQEKPAIKYPKKILRKEVTTD